jgi:hypothetical protein
MLEYESGHEAPQYPQQSQQVADDKQSDCLDSTLAVSH